MTDDDREFCALVAGLDVVGDPWTVLVVRELLVAPADEDELLDGVPGLDRALLREKLDRLCENGLVERDREYRLTPLGLRLRGPLAMLARWGRLNFR
ncbi:helix-turn-helix transcriptional regulator [Amycolatopsis rhizosphaerae]|uniref:Helix-turn-helix transcriptional regulator n=1 Tax=Amycolatopsis rhizosphaerae TaxID=2053003 RepID=A0A558DKD7_9PSEU|nr:helix-turn-helix domain-containing protein [Amycolatopsis rhizosphaerae]TVT61478.1 helix-turn-helix transcriptional regulator [Amycolatopsis rhizosphaerae]